MASQRKRTLLDGSVPGKGSGRPRAGMTIADRYLLLERRGRGGIGEVWEAEHQTTGRRVALKLLLPGWQTDQNVRKRFIREGRLASTMQHRHIVDILEAGETQQGQPYIAMELLQGPSLDVVVQHEGPLPWPRVKRILLQLCGALDHAHGLKIIHRDIKPSNVMLDNEPDEPDRCKLVDFGIAKQSLLHVQTQHLTAEGQMLGSPGFMSPEQLQGRPTDHRSDIYGLGCTGFYLLTGKVPFQGDSLPELIHNALYSLPQPLEVDLDEAVREDLEAVLHRAVHRDCEGRFQSILDVVVALDHVGGASLPRWSQPPAEVTPDAARTVVEEPSPTVDRPMTLDGPHRRASEIPTQATPTAAPQPTPPASPAPEPEVPASGSAQRASGPRGIISTKAHSRVLFGQTTAERYSWGGPEGFVELVRVPPDIIVIHMSGRIASAASWLFEQQLGPLLTRYQPAQLFWHLEELRSFPSDVRDASLRCLTDHRDAIESVHMLKGPGLVGTSVSLATMALGGKNHVYDDEGSWRSALDSWALGRRE